MVSPKRDHRIKLTAQGPEIAERTLARHQLDRKNASVPAGELVREVTVAGWLPSRLGWNGKPVRCRIVKSGCPINCIYARTS
jgi:hypothetical protein